MDGMLSQEEINALLNGMGGEDAAQDTAADTAAPQTEDFTLADSDKDAVGEISNFSMGTAAVQTESALTSIKICFVWIPIAVYVCGLVIMKFYHLDKEFAGIIEDLKKRTQK